MKLLRKSRSSPLEMQSWEARGARESESTSSFSDTHTEILPKDRVLGGQESLEPGREIPMLPSEPLDAAVPEAALPENPCLDLSAAEPINSLDS